MMHKLIEDFDFEFQNKTVDIRNSMVNFLTETLAPNQSYSTRPNNNITPLKQGSLFYEKSMHASILVTSAESDKQSTVLIKNIAIHNSDVFETVTVSLIKQGLRDNS